MQSYDEWRGEHGGNPFLAPPAYLKELDKERKAESARMCDTAVKREDVHNVLLLALTKKDVDNLHKLAAHSKHARNYGVLVRRLIAREAKAIGD